MFGIIAAVFFNLTQYESQPTLPITDEGITQQSSNYGLITDNNHIVSVIFDDGSIKSVPISDFAKYDEQKAILIAITDDCISRQYGIVRVSELVFSTPTNVFRQEGAHAVVSAGCGADKTTTVQEDGGGGFAIYLSKSNDGTWSVDARTQEEGPGCEYVDGKGYPPSILEECYDNSNLRAVQ